MNGTVIKRGNRWSVVIDLGRDPLTGRRIRKWHSGFETRRSAEEARIEILSSVQRGEYVRPDKQPLGKYLIGDWLPAIRASVRASTWDSYSRNLALHVVPRIGSLQMQRLTPGHLNALYAELLREGRVDGNGGLSPRSVRYIHAIIHRALADAVRWNWVARNVATNAEAPRASSSRSSAQTWNSSELRTFLDAAREDRLFAAWLLAATTGMRRGEILGLRWQDIDLDQARLAVRQTLITIGYQVTYSTPKTKKGLRSIALDSETVRSVRRHRALQLEEKLAAGGLYVDADLVFADELGSPIHPDGFGKAFKRIQSTTELQRLRFHDLRHSHATLALQAGIHPKVVSERLGHSTVAMTLDTYSHVLPAMQEDAAERIGELLFGTR